MSEGLKQSYFRNRFNETKIIQLQIHFILLLKYLFGLVIWLLWNIYFTSFSPLDCSWQLFCEETLQPAPEGRIEYFAPIIPTFEALKQISQASSIFRRVVLTCFLDFLKLFPSSFTFSSQFLAHFFLISRILLFPSLFRSLLSTEL